MANIEQALVTLGIIFVWIFPMLIITWFMSGTSDYEDLSEYLAEENRKKRQKKED